MRTKTPFLAAIVVCAASFGSIAGGEPLPTAPAVDGQRYETLRALARHLDVTAQGALEGASDDARHGTS